MKQKEHRRGRGWDARERGSERQGREGEVQGEAGTRGRCAERGWDTRDKCRSQWDARERCREAVTRGRLAGRCREVRERCKGARRSWYTREKSRELMGREIVGQGEVGTQGRGVGRGCDARESCREIGTQARGTGS